jgi:hypothetical protein
MLLHNQECHLFKVFILEKWFKMLKKRFCADSKSEKSDPKLEKSDPKLLFGRLSYVSKCPSMSRSFEQFKVTSVQMSL